MPTSLQQDLRRLRKLKRERDAHKKKYEDLDRTFKGVQAKVYDRLESEGVDSIRLDGTLFVASSTPYATIQDREKFVAWAQEHDEALVELKERAALLNQLVRERLDNGQALPAGVGFYVREVVAQRAA